MTCCDFVGAPALPPAERGLIFRKSRFARKEEEGKRYSLCRGREREREFSSPIGAKMWRGGPVNLPLILLSFWGQLKIGGDPDRSDGKARVSPHLLDILLSLAVTTKANHYSFHWSQLSRMSHSLIPSLSSASLSQNDFLHPDILLRSANLPRDVRKEP